MSLLEYGSLVVSSLALGISLYTLYVVHLQRGRIVCSPPTKLFLFYPDDKTLRSGIQMTCFLYTTGSQGKVIEQLFVEFESGENSRKFNTWHAGSQSTRQQLGGLRVPKEGISLDNLFLTSVGAEKLKFECGPVLIKLYARVVGRKELQLLSSTNLNLKAKQVLELEEGKLVCFEINSNGTDYSSYTDTLQENVNAIGINFMKTVSEFVNKNIGETSTKIESGAAQLNLTSDGKSSET